PPIEQAAKIMGAVAGSLAAIATLFNTLAISASSVNLVPALLIAVVAYGSIGLVAALVTYAYTSSVSV
nr:hypothetical protein [Parachlamydiaceae bacterium]